MKEVAEGKIREWVDQEVLWATTTPKKLAVQVAQIKCVGKLLRNTTMEGYGKAQRMVCAACGAEITGAGAINAHIMWHCQGHEKLRQAREEAMTRIKGILDSSELEQGTHAAMTLPWALEEEVDEQCMEGHDTLMGEVWASAEGIPATVKEEVQKSMAGRGYYKTRAGYAGAGYVRALHLLGIPTPKAQQITAKISNEVRSAQLQAWKVYTAVQHGRAEIPEDEEEEWKHSVEEWRQRQQGWHDLETRLVNHCYGLSKKEKAQAGMPMTKEGLRRVLSQRWPSGWSQREEWRARAQKAREDEPGLGVEAEHRSIMRDVSSMTAEHAAKIARQASNRKKRQLQLKERWRGGGNRKVRKQGKGHTQCCKIAEAFVQQLVDQAAATERRREQDSREADRLAHAVPYRRAEDRQTDAEAKVRSSLDRGREAREAAAALAATAIDEQLPTTPAAQQGNPEPNGSGAGSGDEGWQTPTPVARLQRNRIDRQKTNMQILSDEEEEEEMAGDVLGGIGGLGKRKRSRRVLTDSEEDTVSEEEGERHRAKGAPLGRPEGDMGGCGEGLVGPQDAPT